MSRLKEKRVARNFILEFRPKAQKKEKNNENRLLMFSYDQVSLVRLSLSYVIYCFVFFLVSFYLFSVAFFCSVIISHFISSPLFCLHIVVILRRFSFFISSLFCVLPNSAHCDDHRWICLPL